MVDYLNGGELSLVVAQIGLARIVQRGIFATLRGGVTRAAGKTSVVTGRERDMLGQNLIHLGVMCLPPLCSVLKSAKPFLDRCWSLMIVAR